MKEKTMAQEQDTTNDFDAGCTGRYLILLLTLSLLILQGCEDPLAMVEVLTAERLRLVRRVRARSSSITALAAALKRDPKSVRRDVLKLERAGVVRTREQINPGHGRVKIVEPVAREYRLTAVL
jgi:DNA-binding transcriptional ArsR family regulator